MLGIRWTWLRHSLPALLLAASACAPAADSTALADGGDSADQDDAVTAADHCPAPTGVSLQGRSRFMYGANYAWSEFASDFGGLKQWGAPGVAASVDVHRKNLKDLHAHGADVIRWWVFPDFRGDGVNFDGNDVPTGLGGTTLADLDKALALAEEADVHLMLCLYSFDAFRPTTSIGGLHVPGIAPIVRDPVKRARLLDKVVRPLAKHIQASPHRKRLVAWDVINEPEWAITGHDPYGDPAFTPMNGLDPVDFHQMESFVQETIDVLRSVSSTRITVGSAGMKWTRAWTGVDVDFYQFHIYDWLNDFWPYSLSPKDYGIDDKPVVMGEFPMSGLDDASYTKLVESFYANGYAGAMGWAYDGSTSAQLASMKGFAAEHPCETSYSANTPETAGGSCNDTPPDAKYTCAQQKSWGKCGEAFMQGHCDQVCGRCSAPAGGTCSNTPPDKSYTCAQQKAWGKCGESFMKGHCDKECGRCK